MNKSIISVGVMIVLLTASIGTIANDRNNVKYLADKKHFSQPIIKEKKEAMILTIDGANSVIAEPGKPILPVYTKTYSFPFGTRIKKVECVFSGPIKYDLPKRLKCASEPLYPLSAKKSNVKTIGKTEHPWNNYSTIYPSSRFMYWTGCGLDEKGTHVLFLRTVFYPIQYFSDENVVYYVKNVEIKVVYEKPDDSSMFFNDRYDLLIITPSIFSENLRPLVDHKEIHNIKTKLVTLDEIYSGKYFEVTGRDDAEKIKYFIKNALEEWGIKYVLLVGGRKPGLREEWFVPVRYVNVAWPETGKHVELKYVSDLYYADIYNGNYSFSTWDTDNNNVFSEWGPLDRSLEDDVDLYPDVYVGRWACRNRWEVQTMVLKTTFYENTLHSKKVVLVGGDNFEEGDEIEGEVVTEKTLASLPGFEPAKVYASETDVTPQNIKKALGNGAMFMHLHGHGSPITWGTHKPGEFDKWEKGLQVWNIPTFFNDEYPIVAIGGCHTAMFNISLINHPWTPIPSPEGLSWWFARKYKGGGIAVLGYTCFPVAFVANSGDLDGDGVDEPDCVESGYGYMEINLFAAYGLEDLKYLGECWGYTVSKYVEHFKMPFERYHLHTIQGFALLGDPSLKIEGYQE